MNKRILGIMLAAALFIENGAVSYAAPTDIDVSSENESDNTILILDEDDNDEDESDSASEGSTPTDDDDENTENENKTDKSSEESSADASSLMSSMEEESAKEASSEASSEEYPEDYYTEFPTGYIDIDDEIEIESVTEGYRNSRRRFNAQVLPEYYVTENLPSLKNQGSYGLCWAFATTALAEINAMKKGLDSTPDYSELHLGYFSFRTVNDVLGGLSDHPYNDEDRKLGGGRFDIGFSSYIRWAGVADESVAPYSNAASANEAGLDSSIAYKDVLHLQNYYQETYNTDDLTPVKNLIYEHGAIGIDFYAYNSMSAVTSDKVYSSKNNCLYNPTTTYRTNHAVVVVGWDDNFPKENFVQTPPENGAWLVRNSWYLGDGNEYSYRGYFWMSYYEATIGNIVYAADFEAVDKYDNNYQYYQSLLMDATYKSEDIEKAANIYTAHSANGENGEEISAIAFYTPESNKTFKIDIITNLDEEIDLNVESIYSTTVNTTYAGYYTFELDEKVTLNEGEKFAVVISDINGDSLQIGVERTQGLYDSEEKRAEYYNPYAEAGQSFYYTTYDKIKKWLDYGDENSANFAINVFTNNLSVSNDGSPSDIRFINLEDDELELIRTDTKKVYASVFPANASNRKVTWSSSDSSIATVDSKGLITGVSAGTVIITATTEVGNISRSITVNVVNKVIDLKINCSSSGSRPGSIVEYTLVPTPSDHVFETPLDITLSDDSVLDLSTTLRNNSLLGKVSRPGLVTLTVNVDGKSYSKTNFFSLNASDFDHEVSDDKILTFSWDAAPGVEKYEFYEIAEDRSKTLIATVEPDEYGPCTLDITKYKDQETFTPVTYQIIYSYVEGNTQHSYILSKSIKAYKKYNIIYHVGEGENNSKNPNSYIDIGNSIYLENPSAPDGYYFGGWYLDENYTNRISCIYNCTGDLDLYAKWIPISYYVYFNRNTNNASGYMPYYILDYGQEQKLANNRFIRKNYQFNGWKLSPDTDVISFTDGATIKNLTTENYGSVYLYADWKPISYTITYVLGNETISHNNPTSYTVDDAINLVAPEVSEGVTFEGWYTDSSYSNKITEITSGSTGDLTLYAKLSYNKYTIKFDKNAKDATGRMSDLSMTYDTAAKLSTNGFSLKGYTFNGWKLSADAEEVAYSDYEVVKNLTKENGATITLYADWKPVEYNITYILGDIVANSDENPAKYTADDEIILADPVVNEGISFEGWFSDSTYKIKVVKIDKGSTGDITLYAKYDIQKNTVSFDSKGGSSVNNEVFVYGGSVTKPADPKKNDCTFDGWFKDADCSEGNEYDFDKSVAENVGSNSDFTLFAKWIATPKELVINGTPDTMVIGNKATVTVSVYPSEASQSFSFSYEASNDCVKVEEKDNKIMLTAVNEGKVTLTFTNDTGLSATRTIKVMNANIYINSDKDESGVCTIEEGSSAKFTGIVRTTAFDDKEVSWETSNSDVAAISDETGTSAVVTGVSAGIAYISAVSNEDGSIRASHKVVVTESSEAKSSENVVVVTGAEELRIIDTAKTPKLYASSSDHPTTTLYGSAASGSSLNIDLAGESDIFSNVELAVGKSMALKADFLPKKRSTAKKESYVDTVTNKNVTWVSGNSTIATVTNGTVAAKSAGSTVITAIREENNLVAAFRVTVFDPVTTLTLKQTAIKLGKNQSGTVVVDKILPTTSNDTVIFESNKPNIVSVDPETGDFVTYGTNGSAVITVTAVQSKKSAKCTITVGNTVEKISLDKTKTDYVAIGKTLATVATFNDGNNKNQPVNKTLRYEIEESEESDPSVATINDKGVITGLKEGIVKVVAYSTTDDCEPATKTFTVYSPVKTSALNVKSLSMVPGASYTLKAAITPVNTTACSYATGSAVGIDVADEVTWTVKVKNKQVGENATGSSFIFNPDEAGTYAVTASFRPYGATRDTVLTCNVTVKDQTLTNMTVNPSGIKMNRGEIKSVSANLTPVVPAESGIIWTIPDQYRDVIYFTDEDGIVDGNGYYIETSLDDTYGNTVYVKADKNSDATVKSAVIEATTVGVNNKNKQITKKITVNLGYDADSITIQNANNKNKSDDFTLGTKKSATLRATVFSSIPAKKAGFEKAGNQKVTWESSNPNVATVTTAGKVTGVSNGTATIIATSESDSTVTEEITVTVFTEPTKISLDKTKATMSTFVAEDSTKYSSYNQFNTLTADLTPDAYYDNDGAVNTVVWTFSGTGAVEFDKIETGDIKAVKSIDGKQTLLASLSYGEETIETTRGESVAFKATKPGTVKITAKAGNKTAVCNLTVYTHVTGLNLKIINNKTKADILEKTRGIADYNCPEVLKLKGGTKTVTIKPYIDYQDAPYSDVRGAAETTAYNNAAKYALSKNVTYRSSNPSVASVAANGTVTAKKAGTTYITVTTGETNIQKRIKITVQAQ